MGISKDHAAMPAHAHLNLLGFVSLFLFGFYIVFTLRWTGAELPLRRPRFGLWARLR